MTLILRTFHRHLKGPFAYIIFLALVSIKITAAVPQPQITLPQTTHDFGRVKAAGVLEHALIIKNTGLEKLEITSATSSCRCIKIKLTKSTLAPGETAELTFRFYGKEKKGKFTDYIKVSSNDPKRSIVRLKVTGVVD